MTSTKIEFSFNKIARMSDLADLAELLFPGNRNQQHAFLAMWISLKWADHHIVPNFAGESREQHISRRTLERVRAKMRRMGLIDHVSRFNAKHGYREGWVLAKRFEHGLRHLAEIVRALKDVTVHSREKDLLLLQLAHSRRDAGHKTPDSDSMMSTRGDLICIEENE